MANLNTPVRLRDHHSTVHLSIPSGCSTTTLSTVLGQGAYKANHHFPSNTCPDRASDFHQYKNYTEFSQNIQRSSDCGFQSADSSGVKANADSKPDQYIAAHGAVDSWRKSNCPVTVHSVDDLTAPIKSQSDVSSKPINDTHFGGAVEHHQPNSVPSALPQPTSRISSAANIKPGNASASLSNSFIRPPMMTPSSSNSTSNYNSATGKTGPVQMDSHENTSGFNKQNAAPKDPLPHWNMRLANVMHYPKYNTRKNSGFERRLKHTGLILDPKLTLRLLRKVLQPFINNAVNNVIQHYMEVCFPLSFLLGEYYNLRLFTRCLLLHGGPQKLTVLLHSLWADGGGRLGAYNNLSLSFTVKSGFR
ncbi:Deoxynucleotidyltransferase terminal-interacting protein 1 [Fasciolopsis buskii]|uniref:Deoxynucleotidyltransferase terminal-interacting protein 1 n=1 Tax=Fasciolopsis buskii TaxID=27845 RepID=A0A8E0RQW7_9TREM|nr:Deoxynucleotidyltransferase terminal-interacting protein 1 [Fasciolopsis buski]